MLCAHKMALVDYDSSDSSDSESAAAGGGAGAPVAPVPAAAAGRLNVWPTLVYIAVPADTPTVRTVADAYRSAVGAAWGVSVTPLPPAKAGAVPLHLSLSRHTELRYREIDPFIADLRARVAAVPPFSLSLDGCQLFPAGGADRSRRFMSLLVSSGLPATLALIRCVDAALRELHRAPFYDPPDPHVSIGMFRIPGAGGAGVCDEDDDAGSCGSGDEEDGRKGSPTAKRLRADDDDGGGASGGASASPPDSWSAADIMGRLVDALAPTAVTFAVACVTVRCGNREFSLPLGLPPRE